MDIRARPSAAPHDAPSQKRMARLLVGNIGATAQALANRKKIQPLPDPQHLQRWRPRKFELHALLCGIGRLLGRRCNGSECRTVDFPRVIPSVGARKRDHEKRQANVFHERLLSE